MRRVLLITAVLALLAGVGGAVWLKTRADAQNAVTVAQEQPEPSKYDVGPPDAQEMWELTNEERRKAGLPPLALDPRLNSSAQEKSDDMQRRDYYGHKSPEGVEGYSLVFKHMPNKCQYAGENLATLLVPTSSSSEAIDGWMSSTKGHREAILSEKYTSVGFGVAKDKHGNSLVVQHFCQI